MKIGIEYGNNASVLEDNIEHSSPTTRRCPYGVSNEDIRKVGDLLEFKKKIHLICKSKIILCVSQAVCRHRNVSSNAAACTQTHTWHSSGGIEPIGCSNCSSLVTECHRRVTGTIAA
jgi:hypothetical protein